jgi:hypothetical protein
MVTLTKDALNLVLKVIGLDENVSLLAMHLSEIEEEANNALDLLTSLRAHAFRHDAEAGQEALAELTIALEHLLHHAQAVLPGLQKQLDLAPEEVS